MTKLIIHVGPGKCGSSTIQDFFAQNSDTCLQKTSIAIASAVKIHELNDNPLDEKAISYFKNLLDSNLKNKNHFILSQEYLFETPSAIKRICQLAENLVDDILIIGYCRQQSNFFVSQYSQWLFRSIKRINEVNKYIEHIGLDSMLFSGLERQLIASIFNDFQSARMLNGYSVHNWYESYSILEKTLTSNKRVRIHCSLLPGRDSDKTLIQDFCDKANLTLRKDFLNKTELISNSSFSPDLIEAINLAILQGYEMPGPHSNNLIENLSSKLNTPAKTPSNFILQLKQYIDGYFWQSNQSLCDKYSLDLNYFVKPEVINKSTILNVIKDEGLKREKNKSEIIANNQALCATLTQLCLTQIKTKT